MDVEVKMETQKITQLVTYNSTLKTAGIKNSITQNYKLERVDTNAKLKDFYDKYFRLNDMLDYIEAQAFLTLSEDEQVALATQVSYPRLANQPKEVQLKGDSNVAYEPLTKEKRKNMTLKTVSDLWDNQIMLRPGNRQYDRRSPGADTDSLYNIQPILSIRLDNIFIIYWNTFLTSIG